MRDAVLCAERVLLGCIGFNFNLDIPHPHGLEMQRFLQVEAHCTPFQREHYPQSMWNYMNDRCLSIQWQT